MKIYENVAYQLLDEFKSSDFEIIELDGPYNGYLENPLSKYFDTEEEDKEYWHFELVFKNDFRNSSVGISEIEPNYKTHIEKLCKSFFREISTEIDESHDLRLLNMLTDYRQSFKSFMKDYSKVTIKKSTYFDEDSKQLFLPLNFDQISQEYSKLRIGHLRILFSSFYTTRVNAINNVYDFLEKKLQILNKESTNYIERNKELPQNKSQKRIEKIDRYQIALLFHYLEETELINKNSYVTQAEIINRLTGISAQKLRTECLNKIWEIKSGRTGNSELLKTNSAYALMGIKNILKEILGKVELDLKKKFENNQK